MDVIDPILSIASSIYSLCEQVKANKKSCHSIAKRVHALQDVVEAIRRSESAQACPVVDKALRELHITLISAQDLIKKYTSDKFLMRMLKTFRHRDDFAEVNCRLTDNFQVLCGALQVDQRNKLGQVFDEVSRKAQDEVDRKQDDEELKKCKRKLLFSSVCRMCSEVTCFISVCALCTSANFLYTKVNFYFCI